MALTPSSPTNVTVIGITIASPGAGIVRPIGVRRENLTLGTVPSHGIIEPLRRRNQEFLFPELPSGELVVALRTTTGVERFRVTEEDRARLIRVCNTRS